MSTNADIRTFPGLYLQQNSLNDPDGAMEVAHNVVITSDDVVAKRRGLYAYYTPMGGDTLNHLMTFGNHLMSVYTDKVAYYTDSGSAPSVVGTRTVLTGAAVSVTSPRVSRHIDANKNLYFTADQGVLKIESYDGVVQTAGIPPGLDVRARFLARNGPIEGGQAVAYTVVFGRVDSNANLLLSAPGEAIVLNNAAKDQAPYTSAPSGGGFLVTVTSADPNLAAAMSVTITNATNANANGQQSVVSASGAGFTFQVSSDPSAGTLSWASSRTARVEITIPREIPAGYFYQIYRTLQNPDVPFPEFYKVVQNTLSSGDISTGLIVIDDTLLDELLGAGLYSNPNTGEGPEQTNDRPPNPQDMTYYKNFALFANVATRDTLDLDVVDPSQLTNGDYVQIACGTSGNRLYVARTSVGNSTVPGVPSGATTINVFYDTHGAQTGDTIEVSSVVGSVNVGNYVITVLDANNFTFIAGAGQTASALDFSILKNPSGYGVFQLDNSSPSFAAQLRNTAQGIVRAINRDTLSLVYASYVSPINGTPGEMRLDGQGFNGPISVFSSTDTAGFAFAPPLKQATSLVSMGDSQPNVVYLSKLNQPEAVPPVNFVILGSRSKPIRRIFTLKDSIIVLKDDGVFRMTGETPGTLFATILDNTVFPVNASLAGVINNQVVFLSNQGVCLVSDTGVQIVSRRIEDVIQPIVGNPVAQTQGGCVSYETQRLWYFSAPEPQSSAVDITYVYNVLNNSWTTIDVTINDGVIGPADKLYMMTTGNVILRERKDFTKLDYCDQNYTVTLNSVASDGKTAVIAGGVVVPADGDVLFVDSKFSKILASETHDGGLTYTVTFLRPTDATAGSQTLFKGYLSTMTWAPIHGGKVGVAKQISQMQVHLRTPVFSHATIGFSSNYFGADSLVEWTATDGFTDGGWGQLPWGFFEWGLEDSLLLKLTSREAPIVRVYVPLFSQRVVWMRPTIYHTMASEPLEIQALAFTVRGYNERVTR